MKNKILILFGSIIIFQTCFAQKEVIPWRKGNQLLTGIHFQLFKQNRRNTITQVSFPTRVAFFLSDKIQLQISNTPAWTQWNDFGNVISMKGISDTWVQANRLFMKKQLFVHAGVGMPTGHTRLNFDQMRTSITMSQNFLRLTLPVYGQGFCSSIGGIYSWPVDQNMMFGAGIQYLRKNKYTAFVQSYQLFSGENQSIEQMFKPGDEISLNLGADFLLGNAAKFSLDAMITYYDKDYLNDEKIFGSGLRLILESGIYYHMEDQYVWAHFLYRYKDKNSILQGLKFVKEEKNSNPYQFEMDLHYCPFAFTDTKILLLVDNRMIGPSGVSQGIQIYGFGLGTSFMFNKNDYLYFKTKVFLGQRKENQNVIDISGVEAMMNFQFAL